jgi:hypothetical protein
MDYLKVSKQTLTSLEKHIINHRKMMLCIIYDKYMRDKDIDLDDILIHYCSIKTIIN